MSSTSPTSPPAAWSCNGATPTTSSSFTLRWWWPACRTTPWFWGPTYREQRLLWTTWRVLRHIMLWCRHTTPRVSRSPGEKESSKPVSKQTDLAVVFFNWCFSELPLLSLFSLNGSNRSEIINVYDSCCLFLFAEEADPASSTVKPLTLDKTETGERLRTWMNHFINIVF